MAMEISRNVQNTNLVYSPRYNTNLVDYGIDKPFALDRGQLVLGQLAKEFGKTLDYVEPVELLPSQLNLVHSEDYLIRLHKSEQEWIKIFELKANEYNPHNATMPLMDLFHDISLKAGGTLLASQLALEYGLAANLGGGYHHAFANCGRGFCVLNDIAIAIKVLQADQKINKAMIIDLDFHQGDGTALIFKDDNSVFTLSVHSQEGWPEFKQRSNIDVPIFTGEENLYLSKTQNAINHALKIFIPDLIVFVAGSDPYEKDVLPGTRFLKLSLEQLAQRDSFVIDTATKLAIPLVMVFAGGYGPYVWEVHYNAVKEMLAKTGFLKNN